VEHTATACTALLQNYTQPHDTPEGRSATPPHQCTLTEADALVIVRTAVTGLAAQVQALVQPQRSASLRLLTAAIKVGKEAEACIQLPA